MGRVEQRRDRRYRYQMQAVLLRGGREVSLLTGDVSFRGLFLRTDDPPPLRQLLQVKLKLPPENGELVAHAMAVFVVPAGAAGQTPGVGLQLYAVSAEVRQRWDGFVRWVAKAHPESLDTPMKPVAAALDAVNRQFPRVRRALTVRAQSMGDLHHIVTADVSRGGMFLRTGLDVAIGSELRLFVAHPQTGLTFAVDTVVRRRVESPPDRAGLGVEFVGLDEKRREEFAAFSGLDEMATEDDVVYVAEDDPLLA
ncbi:MAG: PilZ domain-containing protein [Deltaproteobacteria bacterium]|nr:PilZ domain-containing protein [Deltaproteobacteria bacterium]